jgi:hypothetical protein
MNEAGGTSSVAPVAPGGEKVAVDAGPATQSAPGASGAAPRVVPPGAADAPLPTVGEGRAIIRNGSADLEVASVADAFERVRQIATGAGGTVAESSYAGNGSQQSAHLKLRVPVDRFGEVVAKLREIAVEVKSITTGSTDVTDEVTDVEATIRNLRAVEAQYVQLLSRAGSIADVLSVQDRLNQVRLQIDRTEARRQSLASRAEMSTITVSLRPVAAPAVGQGGALASARAAWTASLATLAYVGTAVLVAVVYSWWIVPIVVAALVARRLLHRAERTHVVPSEASA